MRREPGPASTPIIIINIYLDICYPWSIVVRIEPGPASTPIIIIIIYLDICYPWSIVVRIEPGPASTPIIIIMQVPLYGSYIALSLL